jgi:hypothetical protein
MSSAAKAGVRSAWDSKYRRKNSGYLSLLSTILRVMPISKEYYETIAAAIRSAQQRTSGQIVCVLRRSSSGDHDARQRQRPEQKGKPSFR